jgi:proton-dependent oligopeptide transporter, POT family
MMIDSRLKLAFSIFLSTFATYLIIPMLPIYLVAPSLEGGRELSKGEAFSLFGTFLAIVYISPFLGGLLSDFVFGKRATLIFGYFLSFLGTFSLFYLNSHNLFLVSLFAVAFGTGLLRVNLTSCMSFFSSSEKPETIEKDFDGLYIALSLGFILSTFFSQLIFEWIRIQGLFLFSFITFFLSSIFAFFALRGNIETQKTAQKEEKKENSNVRSLAVLLVFGLFFFVFMSQSMAATSVFIHEEIKRELFGFHIPTLWFQAFGSFTMLFGLSYLRKLWKRFMHFSSSLEFLKVGAGFFLLTLVFSLFYVLSIFKEQTMEGLQIGVIALSSLCFSFADAHVRPLLLSQSSQSVSSKYQTLATGCVYGAIGLGGKLGGEYAGCVEVLGFSSFFLLSILCTLFFGTISYLFWRRVSLRLDDLSST